jgi:hypothetical protein
MVWEGSEPRLLSWPARVDDPTLIATASVGKHDPERWVLFLFGVHEAVGTTYEDDEPVRRCWRAN